MIKFILKKFLLPLLAAGLVFIVVDNDSFLYHEPVGQIMQAQTVSLLNVTDNFGNYDTRNTQKLTIKLLNTTRKNEQITLSNLTAQSQVTGQLFRAGQKVLLTKTTNGFQIVSQKRDALILALFTLFMGLMIGFIRLRASLFLLLSLGLNLVYFALAIAFDVNISSGNIIVIFAVLALVFSASSLLFVLGWTRQMAWTLLTTILTTGLTFGIAFAVLASTKNSGVHFEYMEYVTQNPDQFFFAGAISSVLGAIMDGTGDIVAGLFGLHRQNQLNHRKMTQMEYLKSGLTIGREIIGTLTNVLFMIFMAEAFPMSLLLLRNGNSWGYITMISLNLVLLQTLISAIGIVLAVPVTAYVTSFGLVHREKMEAK